MRKIDKDKSPDGVPVSLRLPDVGPFANSYEKRRGRTTHEKRLKVIGEGKYIYDHDDRYKQEDTKTALAAIYHGKCAYCEQRVEAWQVEHYRPKAIYFWLAFSWDNLLAICPTCNSEKQDKFDCTGDTISYIDPPFLIEDIHALLPIYDAVQQPKCVNPEVDDLEIELTFEKDGTIQSAHPRMAYTIRCCNLDRGYLNDDRRKVLDDFRRAIKGEFLKASSTEQVFLIKHAVEKLKAEANDPEEEYTTFRRYILHNWVREEIVAARPSS